MPKKSKSKSDDDNPEKLSSNPENSLFGSKKARKESADGEDSTAAAAAAEAPKAQKRGRQEVLKEDPIAQQLRAAKKQKKQEAKEATASAKSSSSSSAAAKKSPSSGKSAPQQAKQKDSKPHADAVSASNKLWERLRSEKTEAAERERLADEVLTLFDGKVISVLQKHDAARVLQSVFKQGTAKQRDALMVQIAGDAYQVARSHYGHFLLISILRNGAPHHKQQLLKELTGHAAELVVHAEGSAVLQMLYQDVASHEQKAAMYRSMWGKEMVLFDVPGGGNNGGDGASGGAASLTELFEADPLCKGRVLRRLEITLSKAARKGLALTSLVQRGGAEMLDHGEPAQRAELVGAFKEQAVHMMHTKEGARIACGCLRYGDAKDRKAILKGLKGFAARAAQDPNGSLVLCTALETVDDTVLLGKGIVAELAGELPGLAMHAHGSLPLLQVLTPRSKSHFSPEQLAVMGPPPDPAYSKKEAGARRAELLAHLLPPLLAACEAHCARLAGSAHGASVLYEAVHAASEEGAEGVSDATKSAAQRVMTTLAEAALQKPPPPSKESGEKTYDVELVAHPFGARLLKRLAQQYEAFASGLAGCLSGKLLKSSKAGGGWVVLALLEAKGTGAKVKAELKGKAAELKKNEGIGCKSLGEALAKAK